MIYSVRCRQRVRVWGQNPRSRDPPDHAACSLSAWFSRGSQRRQAGPFDCLDPGVPVIAERQVQGSLVQALRGAASDLLGGGQPAGKPGLQGAGQGHVALFQAGLEKPVLCHASRSNLRISAGSSSGQRQGVAGLVPSAGGPIQLFGGLACDKAPSLPHWREQNRVRRCGLPEYPAAMLAGVVAMAGRKCPPRRVDFGPRCRNSLGLIASEVRRAKPHARLHLGLNPCERRPFGGRQAVQNWRGRPPVGSAAIRGYRSRYKPRLRWCWPAERERGW